VFLKYIRVTEVMREGDARGIGFGLWPAGSHQAFTFFEIAFSLAPQKLARVINCHRVTAAANQHFGSL
jgi:hypothetical protein